MSLSIGRELAPYVVELASSMLGVNQAILGRFFVNTDKLENDAGLISVFSSGTQMLLSKLMHVDEKPKVVQVTFPFFSGLVSTSLMAVSGMVPAASVLDTYIVCSAALAGVALTKLIIKRIFSQQDELQTESLSHRVFNYTVVGTVTFIPSFMVGRYFGSGNWELGLVGVFFGLAQVCATTFLGASEENQFIRGALPLITSDLPFAILRGMGEMQGSKALFVFHIITTSAALTALIGTVAMSYLRSPPQIVPAVKEKAKESVVTTTVCGRRSPNRKGK